TLGGYGPDTSCPGGRKSSNRVDILASSRRFGNLVQHKRNQGSTGRRTDQFSQRNIGRQERSGKGEGGKYICSWKRLKRSFINTTQRKARSSPCCRTCRTNSAICRRMFSRIYPALCTYPSVAPTAWPPFTGPSA